MFSNAPVNFKDVLGNVAEYNGKLSQIALDAAKKNAELSQTWANNTLGALDAFTAVQEKPTAYASVAKDFVSAQAKSTPEHVAAFAEVAKQAQIDTVELLLSAGKQVQAEATEVAKKATATKA
jgi:hypothetical protein